MFSFFTPLTSNSATASAIRSTDIALWIDQPNVEATIIQVCHAFTFGFPAELKRFTNLSQEHLDWYTARLKKHFSLAQRERDARWARVAAAL